LAGLVMWLGPAVKLWIDRYFNILTIAATIILILIVVVLRH